MALPASCKASVPVSTPARRKREREAGVAAGGGSYRKHPGWREGGDTDEVGDEGRDDTLEDGRVAPDHVLVVHFRLVELRHHCPRGETPSDDS
ncbi:hypothetical protein E2C01_059969 [Portunus trituberculatus]|uniref:Uncharacterized protein n=1 Tax=Portunus trituberculatus TaxID=210409 RepID=A0A5B7HAQ6_PORTR|nr:hypothetical protein [Portunus trituberculatus]